MKTNTGRVGGKSCTNGEFKVGFSLSYREDQIPRNFVNKSRIVETLGREQILSVPCMVGRGEVGRVDSSRIFFLFFFPFRSIKVKIQKLNSNPFRNTFHRYFNLRLEIKNV